MLKERVLTDLEVEQEIARLRKSPLVALGRREAYIRNQRRQMMYQLRTFEKKGRALADAGITLEMLRDPNFELGYEEAENYDEA